MVCSNCGFENPTTNRFCGMCGTPLPQRPITAPGASSTLDFTRIPIEGAPVTTRTAVPGKSKVGTTAAPRPAQEKPVAIQESAASKREPAQQAPLLKQEIVAPVEESPATVPKKPATVQHKPAAIQGPGGVQEKPVITKPALEPPRQPVASVEKKSLSAVEEVPSRSIVIPEPEKSSSAQADPSKAVDYFAEANRAASLEQFVAGFRYTPPSGEDELTMTGGKPEMDAMIHYESATPLGLSDEPGIIAAPSSAEQPAPIHRPRNPVNGSEPTTVESMPSRSRFLDFSEAIPEQAAHSGTAIVGPSFLGLSDPPPGAAVLEAAAEPSQRSHWRAWLALIVILIFGSLGYMEWRAEKNQTNNGPIGVMKMQIERLTGRRGAIVTPESSSEAIPPSQQTTPATNTAQPNGSGPDLQVVPQQKPQTSPPAEPSNNANPPAEKPVNPGSATNSPSTSSNTMQGAPGGSTSTGNSHAGRTQAAEPNSSTAPVATNSRPTSNTEKAPAQPIEEAAAKSQSRAAKQVPGAEELAKASDASDAAAAIAWLWKSVAKGNPEAPIRLANMYIKGDGVPRSCEQAVVLLKSAAAKENAAARSRLGSLYATGNCVPRDRVRAYEYMSSALEADPHATSARGFREQLWAQMTPQERTLARKYR